MQPPNAGLFDRLIMRSTRGNDAARAPPKHRICSMEINFTDILSKFTELQ
jgi:hypothetical protein